MTDQEIFEKACNKAAENGWDCCKSDWHLGHTVYEVVFRHDFARAFWGEEQDCDCGPIGMISMASVHSLECNWSQNIGWQNHLKKMVVEEEPLQYLKKFL